MAHYARLNSENVVISVTTLDNSVLTDENNVEQDGLALAHLYTTIPDSVGDTWVKTSYNGNIRTRYAAPGMTYNTELDAFIAAKPYPSWTLNTTTKEWDPPVAMPTEIVDGRFYSWDEENQSWVTKYTTN